ncbi:hypothetical protein LR48_Vigan07g175400 [Vigna angularis]|uniref:Uncharacterized protein n=1 Tax=Phaseolus angularis TaxID=3914 RepID=A0A0L9UYX1_PHAAN|nr:hypothetical protein LR48_Vigan07g175400 [Vigna angularis]
MRGKLIKYDRRILNAFLQISPTSSSQVTHFSEFLSGHKKHDEIACTWHPRLHVYVRCQHNGRPPKQCMQARRGEFGERSEEEQKGNPERHQKVQKQKPQPPLSASLPLSGTQKPTLAPLNGEMAAEGKNRARALTVER